MKLTYKGNFNGDSDMLPHGEHKPEAVIFKEPKDLKAFATIMNILSIVPLALLYIVFCLRTGTFRINFIGILLALLALVPHEFLHAICFRDEVYLYTAPKLGALFVLGTETMSRDRFIFMSMLPNIVFGLIPFVIFLFFPQMTILATMGMFATASGMGDYINVFNALTQVPKKGRIYMYKASNYWYIPHEAELSPSDSNSADIA